MQQEDSKLCKLIRKFTIMLVMRIDSLLADPRFWLPIQDLSGVLLAGPCIVQLWKLQLKGNEDGLEKWGPCGCCKNIKHLSLAVVQTFQHPRTSPLYTYVRETKVISWLIVLEKEVDLENSHFMMPRTTATSNSDGNIRLCFFLLYVQPSQAIFLLKSDSQGKASPRAGVI